jgi:hypothetical protein
MQRGVAYRSQTFRWRSRDGLVGLVLALVPFAVRAQDIGPVSFRDSLVMRRVAMLAPCPARVPSSWTLMDNTLGRGVRCSLVEASVRTLEQQWQQRPYLRESGNPRNPLCVRVVVANNTGSTGLLGDWLVMLDLAPNVTARVMIDRQTGGIVSGIVGRPDTTGRTPSCVAKKRERGGNSDVDGHA